LIIILLNMKPRLFGLLFIFVLVIVSCSEKNDSFKVKFEGNNPIKKWPIQELNDDLPADWSGSRFLTFEMNSSSTQQFELRLFDEHGVRRLMIHPFQGVWVRASIPLVHFLKLNTEGMDQASIWKTPRPGYWIGFTRSVGSINNIDSLGVAMKLPIGSPTLELRNFRLTNSAEDSVLTSIPLVDEFGQWIPSEWEGKAKSPDDLKTAWKDEEISIGTNIPEASMYGGFKNKKTKATGFFRVEKIKERWWFVDPDGYLFFSNGSCCIEPLSDLSRTEGREYIYSKLPPAELSPSTTSSARKRNASFYTWNLNRRFGDNWYQRWMDLTSRRMRNWGLNTVGNWSDTNLGRNRKIPYVVNLTGWGIQSGKMGMPDVYDPGYSRMVDSAASVQCSTFINDPYLLGYFIGNEPPWPGREQELAELIITGEPSAMKTAMEKYLDNNDTPKRRKEFVYKTYKLFLETVCSAIKKHDANHLNLGFRLGGVNPDEMIAISKKYFDVFSINIYTYTPGHDIIQNIYDLTGLPIIIGEFHFGVPGRGMAPGLAQTKDLQERAVAYQYYVENAAAHPAIIGTHWFQWIDQPVTGRFDGENYNIGFVDVTDRPYQDMVKASQELFERLYSVHVGDEPPVNKKAIVH
jgi:hypothetical protein